MGRRRCETLLEYVNKYYTLEYVHSIIRNYSLIQTDSPPLVEHKTIRNSIFDDA